MIFRSIEERFFEKIYYCPMSGCWLWGGSTRPSRKLGEVGYGQISSRLEKRPVLAHRVSWAIHNGPIPEGMLVCHICDVRSCVNPKHLFLGTEQDNTSDMCSKNRQIHQRGVEAGRCKLSEEQVRDIFHSTLGIRQLGRNYNVAHTTIEAIKQRRSWRHLDMDKKLTP